MDRYVPLAAEEQIFEYVLVMEVSFDPISENYDWIFFPSPNLEAYLYPHNGLGAGLDGCLAVKIYLDQMARNTKSSISQPAATPVRSEFLDAGKWNFSNPSGCNLSRESAQETNCLWSAMTFAWYPPAYYDEEAEEEILGVSDWQWYAPSNVSTKKKRPSATSCEETFKKRI